MNRTLYSLLLYLLQPLILFRLLWRSLRAPAYRRRWYERFALYRPSDSEVRVWIHTVSVGEFVATIPLIRALMEDDSENHILVTTMTPTGSARVQAEFGNQLQHVYLPYDLPGAVRRFLRHFNPKVGVVMETELWPNLFHQCGKQQISLVLANVRLSQRSLEGYKRWIPKLAAEALGSVKWAAVQGKSDGSRLVRLGMDAGKVSVTGSIKFDLDLPDGLGQQGEALRRELGTDRPVWIAASTREGEEVHILAAHRKILQQIPEALLLLVPRHPERFTPVAQQIEKAKLKSVRRSSGASCGEACSVYLGDTMGELLLLYSAADVAYVGGSLVPTGSHNMLEPAALGKPVLFGPHRFNFAEISQLLIDQGAALEVEDATMLADRVVELLQNRQRREQMGSQGLRVVEQNRGALGRLMSGIQDILEDSGLKGEG